MTDDHKWNEEIWLNLVNQVRAGKSLLPQNWPNNTKCAVAISFDSDRETNELRDGAKSLASLSLGEYGSRKRYT